MQTYNFNKDACQAGALAFENGNGLNANPYPENTQSYRRWERGWEAQKNGKGIIKVEPKAEPKVEPKTVKPRKATASKATKAAPKKAVAKKAPVKKAVTA